MSPIPGRLASGTVLAVAAFGAFLAFLDATIVNVAFPSIERSFAGTSLTELSWVLNGYNIVFGAFLIGCGRLADLLGRRRLFVAGVAIFTVASVACGAASSFELLLVGRLFQALGAAMLVPASLALVVEAFPGARRAHAVGIWGACAAAAAGLGPPLGGALVEAGGWRWAFFINAPFGVLALLAARRWIVESRAPGVRRMPDLLGAALLALSLALLTLAIVQGGGWGWTSPAIVTVFVVAVLAAAAFVVSSRRHRQPLLDIALLRIRPFAVTNLATITAGMGFYAYLLTNILWLQYVWGYSVLRAGAALVPGAVVATIVAALAGRFAERYGYRTVVVPGALIWALAYVWYHQRAGLSPDFVGTWLPGQVISGIGVGATLPVLASGALGAIPSGRYATASAVVSSARQLGGVLGVAVLVVLIGTPLPGTLRGDLRDGWLFCVICFAATSLIATAMGPIVPADESGSAGGPGAALVEVPPVDDGQAAVAEPAVFAQLPAAVRRELEQAANTVHVPAGTWLLRAGEPAESAYVLTSGRMEVLVAGTVVRELAAGAVIGELALLTGGRRSAGIRARRDSTLLEMSRPIFNDVLARDPAALSALVGVLASRLAAAQPPPRDTTPAPRIVTVLALHAGAPAHAVAAALVAGMPAALRTITVAEGLNAARLERIERDHDRVLLVGAGDDPQWDAFCLGQADLVVLVARADVAPSTPSAGAAPDAPDLVLVGPRPDRHTLSDWSEIVGAARVTTAAEADLRAELQPLARRIAGRSLGIVLAGGGARSLVQIGVLRELEEAGLSVDRIAGCSMGSLLGALYATGLDGAPLEAICYAELVRRKPLGDYTLPRKSLLSGRRVDAVLKRRFGDAAPIEALPRQFRCVSTDLRARAAVVHSRGDLAAAVRASSRLPVLLPPVRAGKQILIDGAILNNLPVELLTARDEGPIVVVNVPGGSAAPTGGGGAGPDRARNTRIPSLGETVMRTMLIGSASSSRAALAAGAYVITPPALGVGLLEFHQFDVLVAAGRAAARRLLESTGGALTG